MRGGGGGGRGGGGGLGGGLGGGGGRGHRRNLGRSRGGAGGGAGGGGARGGGGGGRAVVLLALALRGGGGRRGTSSSTVREGGGLGRLALLRCLRVGPRLVCLGRSRRASALRGSSLRAAARLGGVWRGERHWGRIGEDAGCPALLNELAQPTCSGCSGCGGLCARQPSLNITCWPAALKPPLKPRVYEKQTDRQTDRRVRPTRISPRQSGAARPCMYVVSTLRGCKARPDLGRLRTAVCSADRAESLGLSRGVSSSPSRKNTACSAWGEGPRHRSRHLRHCVRTSLSL